jgi:hypothetical protein
MKTKAHTFKTFPEFSDLKLEDREAYNKMIVKYPPVSEISFSTLMTWWSSLGNCKISLLNGNLVVAYWLPGDELNSGLSLIGTNKIDESMCEIFDYQKARGEECRLVHVPEFTMSKIHYPGMYDCEQETDYNEIILSVENSADFERTPGFIRSKIATFLKATKGKIVTLKVLDPSKETTQDTIIKKYYEWQERQHPIVVNELPKYAEDAFLDSVKNAKVLNQEVLSLFIDDEMHSFTVHEKPSHPQYSILKYSGFSCEVPGLYEFACYRMAGLFSSQGIKYVNMAIHIGDPRHTAHRLALRPINNFRKFSVIPTGVKNKKPVYQETKEKSL